MQCFMKLFREEVFEMIYDYYCTTKDCKTVLRNIEKSIKDPTPNCPLCGKQLERLFDQQVVFFDGFSTPGGNGRPCIK